MPRAPAFSALFLLSEPVSGRAFRGQVEDSVTDEPEGALVRHAGGWESGDFLWTDRALVCVSERVLRTLRVNAITGWEAFSVEIHTRGRRLLEGYAGLRVTGACGPLDVSESERITKITPGGIEKAYLGIGFDRDSWDGGMIFRPQWSSAIVVTERVRAAFGHAKIGNVDLRRLDTVEVTETEVARWQAGDDG